jgi:CBS domain-containing protein
MMSSLGVGALPICGPDGKIKGVVTDRDLVVKVAAQGRDLGQFPAGDLNQNEAVTIGADDPVDDVLATMTNHKVRRLPVIDGDKLVGMISIADVARALPNPEVGELVEALTAE